MRTIAIILACLGLSACLNLNAGLGGGPPCEINRDGDLLLRGHTTEPMLACVERLGDVRVSRVVLDSTGGPLPIALKIGDWLAKHRAEMVVRGQCNSACANYFLPVARRIVVEPGSMVLLHGSADGAALARSAATPGSNVAKLQEQFEAQAAFVQRHGVHRGWLLMRSAEDMAAKRGGSFNSGTVSAPFSEGKVSVKAVLAEETFMRSCLRNIEIAPFNETVAQRVYTEERLARSLANQGIFPSGSMACIPETVMIGDTRIPDRIPPTTLELPAQDQAH